MESMTCVLIDVGFDSDDCGNAGPACEPDVHRVHAERELGGGGFQGGGCVLGAV